MDRKEQDLREAGPGCRKAWKLVEGQRGWHQGVRLEPRETPEVKGRLNLTMGRGLWERPLGSEVRAYQGVRMGSQENLASLGSPGLEKGQLRLQ